MADEAIGTMKLRYAGKCAECGAALPAGATARYDKGSRKTTCVECPTSTPPVAQDAPTAAVPAQTPAAPAISRRKVIKLRFAGTCGTCGATLPAKAEALYDQATKTAYCLTCVGPTAVPDVSPWGPVSSPPPAPVELAVAEPLPAASPPVPSAAAGESAQAEHDRRHAKRDAKLEAKWGRFAGVAKFFSDDPQTTKAWAKGAEGERRLARHLERELGDRAVFLHDRKYKKWNIDHLVLASTGIWVIDAKAYAGRVEYRNVGGWLGPVDNRIYVGGRDKTKLATGLEWQVTAVHEALGDLEVPIQPALCFVNGENWSIRPKHFRHQGVLVVWAQKLAELIGAPGTLEPEQVEAVARRLSEKLKPAT